MEEDQLNEKWMRMMQGMSIEESTKFAVAILTTLCESLSDSPGVIQLNGTDQHGTEFFVGVCTNQEHVAEVRRTWDAIQEAVE